MASHWRLALALAACIAAAAPAPARACGQCAEDKVAATFDYDVLARAARAGHVVVFTEIRGPAAGAGGSLRAFIARTLAATPGVDPGTVRVSLNPPAASFACDPVRHAPERLLASVNPRLAAKKLRLAVLKVDRGVAARVPAARPAQARK